MKPLPIKSKRWKILQHLKIHKTMTSVDAIYSYGATRISDDIFELRKRGHQIKTIPTTVIDRYGNTQKVATYKYEGGPNA